MARSLFVQALLFVKDISIANVGGHVLVDHLIAPLNFETSLQQIMLALVATIACILPDPPTPSDNYRLLVECLAYHVCCSQAMHLVWPRDNIYVLIHRPDVSALDRLVMCLVSAPFFAIGRRVVLELGARLVSFAGVAALHVGAICTAGCQHAAVLLSRTPGLMSSVAQVVHRMVALSVAWSVKHAQALMFGTSSFIKSKAELIASTIYIGSAKVFSLLSAWMVSCYRNLIAFTGTSTLYILHASVSAIRFLISNGKSAAQWMSTSFTTAMYWAYRYLVISARWLENTSSSVAVGTAKTTARISVSAGRTAGDSVSFARKALLTSANQVNACVSWLCRQVMLALLGIRSVVGYLSNLVISSVKSPKVVLIAKIFIVNFLVIATVLFAYHRIIHWMRRQMVSIPSYFLNLRSHAVRKDRDQRN